MPLNWTCLVIQHISTVPHQIGIPALWSHPLFKDNVVFINIFLCWQAACGKVLMKPCKFSGKAHPESTSWLTQFGAQV